jgi:hypothetical protein
LLEPWLTPGAYKANKLHSNFVDLPNLKIARITQSRKIGSVSVLEMQYLVGSPEGTRHFIEVHELGLFEPYEMQKMLQSAGLVPQYHEQGLTGRGLWIGKKRLS